MVRRTAPCHSGRQRGHVDIGVSLAVIAILGGVALVQLLPRLRPGFPAWDDWPEWAQLAAILVAVAAVAAGMAFENARRWPNRRD